MRIVNESLVEAILLVLLVLFVFLKNWRSIVIVATSIPVSIIGTFVGMYLLGYSINVLSLAGLALCIGMIVDDAIVVLENIYRHRYEEGKGIVKACVDGTREVGMAVFMSTLTTAAVFMPVLMLRGEVGTLFGPVAFVISVAIFLSLFDAFTVVPMLASRWMKEEKEPSGLWKKIMAPLDLIGMAGRKIADGLIWSLRFFLAGNGRKAILIVVVLALFALSEIVLPGMGYLPVGGTNLIKIQVETYEGTSLEENSRLMLILEDRWREIKGVRYIVATPNRNIFRNVIYLVCDREEDSGVSIPDIARRAFALSQDLPFKAVNPVQFPLFGNIYTRSNIVDVRIMGKSYDVIDGLVKQIMEIGKETRGIIFRYTELALRKPQVEVRVDHQRAAHYGLQVKDVANAVEAAVGGQKTTSQYDVDGRYYYIRVMGEERDFQTVADMTKIILTSPLNSAVQVPLTSVAGGGNHIRPAADQSFQFQAKRSCAIHHRGSAACGGFPGSHRQDQFEGSAAHWLRGHTLRRGKRTAHAEGCGQICFSVVCDRCISLAGHAVSVFYTAPVNHVERPPFNHRGKCPGETNRSPVRFFHHFGLHHDGRLGGEECHPAHHVRGSTHRGARG